jgi:ATP-dependent DNA ligase
VQLSTLYKRAKTGTIVYYSISTNNGEITKETGQLGTKSPILHKEQCTSKNQGKTNATTPTQQAELQAASDWKRKKDEGYKSLEDLGLLDGPTLQHDGHRLNWYRDNPQMLQHDLNLALPKYNSDANGQAKPMLALDWKKVKSIQYPVYIQPKLDGVRCLMIVNSDEQGQVSINFLSRSGKYYNTLEHIQQNVLEYAVKNMVNDTFILDGEIYSDELSFQEITAAVKKQRPESFGLHFRAYDIIDDRPQHQRLDLTRDIVVDIGSEFITLVQTTNVYDETQVKSYHDAAVQSGYEGAMLRLPEGKYEQGCRSRSLLKVKEFLEEEFAFSHYEFGQRGVEDLLAVCWTNDRKQFKAKMMGNKADKEAMYKNYGNLKSPMITLKFFGWTDDGLPRFPIGKAIRDYD